MWGDVGRCGEVTRLYGVWQPLHHRNFVSLELIEIEIAQLLTRGMRSMGWYGLLKRGRHQTMGGWTGEGGGDLGRASGAGGQMASPRRPSRRRP